MLIPNFLGFVHGLVLVGTGEKWGNVCPVDVFSAKSYETGFSKAKIGKKHQGRMESGGKTP
jgi:hypothetical protein